MGSRDEVSYELKDVENVTAEQRARRAAWLKGEAESPRRRVRTRAALGHTQSMIRTIAMLAFWGLAAPVAALIGFPWTFITGDIRLLYRMFMFGAWNGVRLTGVRVQTVGLDTLDPARTYIFMSNHVSNLDPPITIPLIPRRTSVMVKKELFNYPILGRAMRMGSLVPVDRGNRDAGIESVRFAKQVVEQGLEHDDLRGRPSLVRRQAPAVQEGAVLSGNGVWSPGGSSDDHGHAPRNAEGKICDQAGNGDSDFSSAD